MTMLKRQIQTALVCLTFLLAGPVFADDKAFVEGFEDLPLMAGLAMADEGSMAFDAPEGRIIEAYAHGQVSEKKVLSFYKQVLPELGWIEKSPGVFQREGELLKLEIPKSKAMEDEIVTVRFALSPYK